MKRLIDPSTVARQEITIRRKPVPNMPNNPTLTPNDRGLQLPRSHISKGHQAQNHHGHGNSPGADDDPTKSLPEYRLPLCVPFSLLVPIGLFTYGWSAQTQTHWIVPNIGACIFAFGLIVCFNCAQAYVVDTYTTYAASAAGAAAFIRTMAGFSFPLFAPQMFDQLGVGMGNSVLALVSLFLGLLVPVMLWRWGAWLRSKSTYCVG